MDWVFNKTLLKLEEYSIDQFNIKRCKKIKWKLRNSVYIRLNITEELLLEAVKFLKLNSTAPIAGPNIKLTDKEMISYNNADKGY